MTGRDPDMRVSCPEHAMAGRETSRAPVSAKPLPVRRRSETSFRAVIWEGFRFLAGRRSREFVANRIEAQDLARDRFAAMLRHPFPGECDTAVARAWAPRLQRSEKQMLNWLRCTHSAPIEDIYMVGATLGVWTSAQVLVGERTRDDILSQIARGS